MSEQGNANQNDIWTGDAATDGAAPAHVLLLDDLLLVATETRRAVPSSLHAFRLHGGAVPRWPAPKTFEKLQITGLTGAGTLFPEPRGVFLVTLASTDIFGGHGLLLALDGDGQELWRWQPAGRTLSAAAVADRQIWVTEDGQTLWTLTPDGAVADRPVPLPVTAAVSAPLVAKDLVCVPCRSTQLLGLNRAGEVRWVYHTEADGSLWLDQTPAIAGERLFASFSRGQVVALDRTNGSELWRQRVGDEPKPLSPPAIAGSLLVVGARDGLYALDPASGDIRWHFATSRQVEGAPVAMAGHVLFSCHDHHVYALDNRDGSEVWRSPAFDRRLELAPILTRRGEVLGIDRAATFRPRAYASIRGRC